jgi:hypothetical protein
MGAITSALSCPPIYKTRFMSVLCAFKDWAVHLSRNLQRATLGSLRTEIGLWLVGSGDADVNRRHKVGS